MTDTNDIKECILRQLPLKWQNKLKVIDFSRLEEIRFRVFLPTMLYYSGGKREILQNSDEFTDFGDLEIILAAICKNSVYAYCNDIAQGFVTLDGGHRAGISGRGVKGADGLSGLSGISGINIRIARQVKSCADGVISYINTNSGVKNVLIVSPPSAGKTTMLRELARILSDDYKVCVIDERSEIAAMSKTGRGFDLGCQTDVLDSVPKKEGITMALRSLSPEVIITDEIDTESDTLAVKNILGAGAKVITSAHSEDIGLFIKSKSDFLKLFDVLVVLSRKKGAGTVEEVLCVNDLYN